MSETKQPSPSAIRAARFYLDAQQQTETGKPFTGGPPLCMVEDLATIIDHETKLPEMLEVCKAVASIDLRNTTSVSRLLTGVVVLARGLVAIAAAEEE